MAPANTAPIAKTKRDAVFAVPALRKPLRLASSSALQQAVATASPNSNTPGADGGYAPPASSLASLPRIPLAEISLALADSRGELIRRRVERERALEYNLPLAAFMHVDAAQPQPESPPLAQQERQRRRRSSRKAGSSSSSSSNNKRSSPLSPFCQSQLFLRLGTDHSILNASNAGVLRSNSSFTKHNLSSGPTTTSHHHVYSDASGSSRLEQSLLQSSPNASISMAVTDDTPDLDSDDDGNSSCSSYASLGDRQAPVHSTPPPRTRTARSASTSSSSSRAYGIQHSRLDENSPSPVRRRHTKELGQAIIKPSLSDVSNGEHLARLDLMRHTAV